MGLNNSTRQRFAINRNQFTKKKNMKAINNTQLFSELTAKEAETLSGGLIPIPWSSLITPTPFNQHILQDMISWENGIRERWISSFGIFGS